MKTKLAFLKTTRRNWLKTAALAGAAAAWAAPGRGQGMDAGEWRGALLAWLETLARPDGGYGWPDQERSHLTPTFAAIGCHQVLRKPMPRKEQVAAFVRTHHPSNLKKLEQERRLFDFQQAQALAWLGAESTELREKVGAWTRPVEYMKAYEQHGYPVFQSELGAVFCRELLGLPMNPLRPQFAPYLEARRRANGSFNNTPASDGSDGHVANTWWGLEAMRALGRAVDHRRETVAWLQSCQLANGGFTYQPRPEYGGVDDVYYTWAAVRALKLLGAAPENRAGCVQYLCSLANADGGFGDRPGWHSNPVAACRALEALDSLGALKALDRAPRRPPARPAALPAGLRVFSVQIEAHGQGSPAEAVHLAAALRIHLWGAKNAKPEWLAAAQAIADRSGAPVKFFVANEEYGTWVKVPGMGLYSHTSDILAPAGREIGPSLAGSGAVSWPEFRARRLAPLLGGQGRLVWQFGENEELVRIFLDDSLERGGYAAISTFHFGNPDFTNSEPFLLRWRGRIPYVALQDAHGPEPWWFADMTAGFRTLFLATAPTWAEWLEALRRNWVVAVRRDALSGGRTWMHGGSRETIEFVRQRESEWRWWNNPDIERPLVSLVAVRPEDSHEAVRPRQGVTLRVRCAWENTAQGLLKRPLAELSRLSVDGRAVEPALVEKKRPNGLLEDRYHHFHIPAPAAGRHTAVVLVRGIETGAQVSRTVQFEG